MKSQDIHQADFAHKGESKIYKLDPEKCLDRIRVEMQLKENHCFMMFQNPILKNQQQKFKLKQITFIKKIPTFAINLKKNFGLQQIQEEPQIFQQVLTVETPLQFNQFKFCSKIQLQVDFAHESTFKICKKHFYLMESQDMHQADFAHEGKLKIYKLNPDECLDRIRVQMQLKENHCFMMFQNPILKNQQYKFKLKQITFIKKIPTFTINLKKNFGLEPQIFQQVLTVKTRQQHQYNKQIYHDIILQRKIQYNEDNREQIKISAKNCEQILEKKADIFAAFDQINEGDHNIMSIIVDTIMNKPYTKQQKSISNQIQTKLKANVQQNGDSFNLILLILKKQLEDRGFTVNLQQKSSVRTKLSIKILTTGYMTDKIKCIETIQQGESEWSFKDIKKSILSMKEFEQWYKQKKAKQFGVPKNQITIHQITNCCTKVNSSMRNNAAAGAAGNKKQNPQRNQQFTDYFIKSFSLSIEDFDTKGDIKFQNQKQDIQRRGGWPYYQPIKCNRYGIKISGKYDGGDDSWLQMDGNPKQWAVAFHGVSLPGDNWYDPIDVNPSNSTQNITKLQNIMNGLKLKNKQMLHPGFRNAYKHEIAVNKPEIIGKGIYCTPHIQEALEYAHASFNKKLVLQCRVNPKQILICSTQQYWVIRQSKNIRPYGIILVDENVDLPTQIQQFNETFRWSKYEQQIKKNEQIKQNRQEKQKKQKE